MRRRAFLLAPGLLTVPARAATMPKAVASFSILADMTRQIAGDRLEVVSLVPANTDPHAFQPKASDSRVLASAAVLVENGLGLEGWMTRLGEAAGFRGRRIVATTRVTPRTMKEGLAKEGLAKEGLAKEGSAVSVDPHAWQNPRNGMLYVRAIAEGLSAAFPGGAEGWNANATRYIAAIEETDAWIASRFAAIPPKDRRIVTTHDAFGYYGDRYGVTFLAARGVSPEAEPSAKGIAALIRQIKREKVRAVFLENMSDPRTAAMLARETGAALSGPLFSDALSPPDGPAADYIAMLRHNTSLFERAMTSKGP